MKGIGKMRHGSQKVMCVVVLLLLLQILACYALNPEGRALLRFRSKVDGDSHGDFSAWDPEDGDPCKWSGVHCSSDGKVECLNIKELSLVRILAAELGDLSHLKFLKLDGNSFSHVILLEIGMLQRPEPMDLMGEKLDQTIPDEIGKKKISLKLLLQGDTLELEKVENLFNLKYEKKVSCDPVNGVGCINRKIGCWFKLERGFSDGHGEKHGGFAEPYIMKNVHQNVHDVRRRLLQDTNNLVAVPVRGFPPEQFVTKVPSTGSGSFPAIPNSKSKPSLASPPPKDVPPSSVAVPPAPPTIAKPAKNELASSKKKGAWGLLILIPVIVVVLIVATCIYFICRRKGAATIGPWKTGLSGQLQKAFVTGVPKLNQAELEAACEDFSNIIITSPEAIVYKGTLSNGMEISVASTAIKSVKDWGKNSEMLFRRKIDVLSQINHKNFVNLLGYCEEDEPFMRMMVFEYASSGSLYEHLHVKDFEHLDWSARMRIIMGIGYCLQYMHHELNPPIAFSGLQSNSIFLTDDYAAKVSDMSVWKEIAARQSSGKDDMDLSYLPFVDPGSNIYTFAIIMLEIISGKLPNAEDNESLLNLVSQFLNDKSNAKSIVDPTLKTFKDNELDKVCQVIQECTGPDLKARPTMREVIFKLQEVIAISPEAATPRLSPLWWAELEILSMEAS